MTAPSTATPQPATMNRGDLKAIQDAPNGVDTFIAVVKWLEANGTFPRGDAVGNWEGGANAGTNPSGEPANWDNSVHAPVAPTTGPRSDEARRDEAIRPDGARHDNLGARRADGVGGFRGGLASLVIHALEANRAALEPAIKANLHPADKPHVAAPTPTTVTKP